MNSTNVNEKKKTENTINNKIFNLYKTYLAQKTKYSQEPKKKRNEPFKLKRMKRKITAK